MSHALAMLADGLMVRYHHTWQHSDLTELAEVARQALPVNDPGHSRTLCLVRLQHALWHIDGAARREGRRLDDDALHEVATVSRDLAMVLPPDDAAHRNIAQYAALTLAEWSVRTANMAEFDDAIELQSVVVDGHASNSAELADAASRLADLLRFRILHGEQPRSPDSIVLYDRIVAAREVAANACTDHRDLIRVWLWAEALREHPQAKSNPALLDRSMRALRRLLELVPAEDVTNRAITLANLSVDLRTRYDEAGELDVLDEAEKFAREAVSVAEGLPEESLERVFCLSNLGIVLAKRYQISRVEETLDAAITITRRTVNAGVLADPQRTSQCSGCRLATLADLLVARYRRFHHPDDLKEAIAMGRRAVAATPSDHREWTCRMVSLGGELVRNASGDAERLREGIQLLRLAAAKDPLGHPHRSSHRIALGKALEIAQPNSGDVAWHTEAIEAYRAAATDELALSSDQIRAARAWAAAALRRGDSRSAADGYRRAIRLLPLVAGPQLRQTDQQQVLTRYAGLSEEAAACFLQQEARADALEILEHGRGILLGRGLDAQADLATVFELDPELASSLVSVTADLDGWDPAPHIHRHDVPVEAIVSERRSLVERRNRLLERIRELPGLEDFLREPRIADLRHCATDGPIVIVNIATARSDALCLTASELRVVSLPEVTPAAVADHAATVSATPTAMRNGADASGALHMVLRWLWDAIAGPVLTELGFTSRPTKKWPRLWWVPTGALAFLPLHAAGYHEERHEANPRTVLDRVVSSYTPTVRILHDLRARTPDPNPSQKTLLVSMPETPGAAALPAAAREADIVAAHRPGCRALRGRTATHDAVLHALRECSSVHFACHAHSDGADPSASRILVNDSPITVAEILRLRLNNANFAYLSACSTVRTAPALADEAIHITSAFQIAGFRDVIGTMWEIRDQPAVRMTDAVYRLLNHTGQTESADVARALHEAIHQARERHWADAPVWAAYVHAGV
jgi:tetratricopeptide (TPR) repeat protein